MSPKTYDQIVHHDFIRLTLTHTHTHTHTHTLHTLAHLTRKVVYDSKQNFWRENKGE